MNASLAACISSAVPALGLLLQGAATGALVASAALLHARRRGWQVEAWAITAAWSLSGAAAAAGASILAAAVSAAGSSALEAVRALRRVASHVVGPSDPPAQAAEFAAQAGVGDSLGQRAAAIGVAGAITESLRASGAPSPATARDELRRASARARG